MHFDTVCFHFYSPCNSAHYYIAVHAYEILQVNLTKHTVFRSKHQLKNFDVSNELFVNSAEKFNMKQLYLLYLSFPMLKLAWTQSVDLVFLYEIYLMENMMEWLAAEMPFS